MQDDISDIAAFYDSDPGREDSRLQEHQLERDLTWRYLVRYLPDTGRILDVGAASGSYAIPLAQRGYRVTAVDLSERLLEVARVRAQEEGVDERLDFVVADARDLTGLPEGSFDAVLMMGPLYHLVREADRRSALRQAWSLLRSEGMVFSALLSRLGVLGDLLKRSPQWIQRRDEVDSLMREGHRPEAAPEGGFRGYFAEVGELVPLHESEGFQTVVVAAVEPVIGPTDEIYNSTSDDDREGWLDLLEQVSTDPSVLGASRHLLYVGRKTRAE